MSWPKSAYAALLDIERIKKEATLRAGGTKAMTGSTTEGVLTAEMIDRMEAGPEMDRIIHDKVMGGAPIDLKHGQTMMFAAVSRTDNAYSDPLTPCYSTDIAAAWEVIEHLRGVAHSVGITLTWGYGSFQRGAGWKCDFMTVGHSSIPGKFHRDPAFAEARTAPLAICKAALKFALAK